ncbi:hypothetical protein [Georgenia sp. AZ-5]|uniref:oxidoreductase n=1 Tax=Georgenia sp. AZ-5 TaxID=3367526 RepID=UPI00375534EF
MHTTLTTPLALPCGAVVPNRIVMAPMVVQGSDPADGHVTDEDVDYFSRRRGVAGMIVTGAAFVNRQGRGFERQLSIAEDGAVEGLARMAAAMKKDGNLAIVQIYHGGREAHPAATEFGRAVAPSTTSSPGCPTCPRR